MRPCETLAPGRLKPKNGPLADLEEELRAVGQVGLAEAVEDLHRQPAGIGGRLHHDRRHRTHQDRLRDALRAVASDEPRHLAAARRVADHRGALQIEGFEDLREIVGIRVHVVAVPGLAGAAMAAAVMGDAAVAVRGQEEHLRLPGVGCERPAVAEDHGRPAAPVLVVDLGPVLRRDRAHRPVPPSTDLTETNLGCGRPRAHHANGVFWATPEGRSASYPLRGMGAQRSATIRAAHGQ